MVINALPSLLADDDIARYYVDCPQYTHSEASTMLAQFGYSGTGRNLAYNFVLPGVGDAAKSTELKTHSVAVGK
jgi:hypothetical protein